VLFRTLLLLPVGALVAACATTQPKPPETPPPTEYLVRKPAFSACELDAFISLGAARNAVLFHDTRESLLAVKGNSAFQIGMINELFDRMRDQGLRDYPMFAAEKFYQCAERKTLPVTKNMNGAAICFARQDIVFFLNARKTQGRSQAEATAMVKKMFLGAPAGTYPEALIEQTAPMVYRASSDEDFYEVRRLAFETCLFPEDWKAWWNSSHPEVH